MTPTGASRSTSSRSPSPNGRRWLDERGLIDRAPRVALLVDDEIARSTSRRARGPTIIAGSTGTNRATARLIAAIARAPQGAVVLPDLDQGLDDGAWANDRRGRRALGHRRPSAGGSAPPDRRIGVERDDVASARLAVARAWRRARLPQRGAAARRVDRSLARARRARVAAGRRRRARRRRDRRRRQRKRGGPGARHRDARNAGDAGQDRGADHARSVDRAPRRGRARALGRRGRGFGRANARPDRGRRVRAARPRSRDRHSRRATFSPCSLIRRRASALRAPTLEARRARLELGLFRAVPLSGRSTTSNAAFAPARAAAATSTPIRRPRALTRPTGAPPRPAARRRAAPLAPLRALAPERAACATSSRRIGPRWRRSPRRTPRGRRKTRVEDAPGGEALIALMDEWGEAAGESLSRARSPTTPRCSTTRWPATRAAGERRPSAAADPRPARGAAARLRSRALARASTKRSGRRRSRPTPFSTVRCARARPSAAGAAHRPDRARFRRRARRARGDPQPREETRRRADRRLALSAAHRRRRGRRPHAIARRRGARRSAISASPARSTSRPRSAPVAPRAAPAGRAAPARVSASRASRRCAATPMRSTPSAFSS